MQELFADMGLPLAQTRQLFGAMELTYRNEFVAQLEKCVEKFGLTDLMYPSFVVKFGYRLRYGASDMVYILLAVLEQMVRVFRSEILFNKLLLMLLYFRVNLEIPGSATPWIAWRDRRRLI